MAALKTLYHRPSRTWPHATTMSAPPPPAGIQGCSTGCGASLPTFQLATCTARLRGRARFTDILGISISETTMRPDPCGKGATAC